MNLFSLFFQCAVQIYDSDSGSLGFGKSFEMYLQYGQSFGLVDSELVDFGARMFQLLDKRSLNDYKAILGRVNATAQSKHCETDHKNS